jgi:cyclic pyranopterin monophosphate synthase
MPAPKSTRSGMKMMEVGAKATTRREATASGVIQMSSATLQAIREKRLPKGDALAAAETAGLLAAKATPRLLPLCHPVVFTGAEVKAECDAKLPGVKVTASIGGKENTGFEMEALTAAAVALLTIYDMAKALEPGMVISEIALQKKSGGKSGLWRRGQRRAK